MLISSGYASELDDCVLNGLRGVNSDVAARMVKQACESKIGGRQNAELVEKYGAPISADLEVESWDTAWKSSTLNVIANLRNNSSQTVLYVVLGVATPNNNDTCPYSWEYKRKFLYRVRLKPDSVGAFVIPDGGSYRKKVGGGICLQGTAVRGRAARFIDVDLGSYEPLPDKEVSSVNAKLNTSYAVPPPEPAAPSSINYFELLKIAPDLNPNSKSRSGK
jgi:hypothetical protein